MRPIGNGSPSVADLAHIFTHTSHLWSGNPGKRFFITGGTGFFGRWLLESLVYTNAKLALGLSATVLTRSPKAFAAKAPHLSSAAEIDWLEGDVRSFVFPAGRYDGVIHAATDSSARHRVERPYEIFDAIVGGTKRVLTFAAQSGAKKFLFTSSGAVYGRQPADLSHLPEEYLGAPDPLSAASAYGEGKRAAEHLCAIHALRAGFEVKIARCFAFVGPYLPLDGQYAVGDFIRDAMSGGPIRVSGDGTPYRSYLYAADLAVWLWTILFQGTPQRAYNVGSAEALPIADLAQRVAAVTGGNISVLVAQAPCHDQPISRYVPAVNRAQRELGLRVWIPLEEGLRRTILHAAKSGATFR
jgi:nucleoside-diphosphate-sugar epimerase